MLDLPYIPLGSQLPGQEEEIMASQRVSHSPINKVNKDVKCVVLASADVDLDTILRVLADRVITPVVPGTLPALANSLLDTVASAISEADIVLAVISQHEPNSTLIFELGYAYALQKRLVILVPPDSEELPMIAAGLLQLRTKADNDEAIGFALDQVLAAPRRGRQVRQTTRPGQLLSPQVAEGLLARLHSVFQAGTREGQEAEVAAIVIAALQSTGINALVREETINRNSIVDLVVWIDEIEATVGNPLLIEVKARLRGKSELVQSLQQIEAYLGQSTARTALLLYGEGTEEHTFRLEHGFPNLLILDVRTLLVQLQEKSFGAVIRTLRNRVVHHWAS
jgi:hypothetical protein